MIKNKKATTQITRYLNLQIQKLIVKCELLIYKCIILILGKVKNAGIVIVIGIIF